MGEFLAFTAFTWAALATLWALDGALRFLGLYKWHRLERRGK